MTKIGRQLNKMTKGMVQASGIAARHTGEAVSKAGRAVGISDETCDKIQQKSENISKDIYYAGHNVGRKTEKLVDEVVNDTKRAVDKVKERFERD